MSAEFYCILLSHLVDTKSDVLLYYNNCLSFYTLIFSTVEIIDSYSSVYNCYNVIMLLS